MGSADAMTSVRVAVANLQHGKHPLGGSKQGHKDGTTKDNTSKRSVKSNRTVQIGFGLVVLACVACAGTLIAKKGFPDIDPVKVRVRVRVHAAPDLPAPSHPSAPPDQAPILFLFMFLW